jgi:hypothetical protein
VVHATARRVMISCWLLLLSLQQSCYLAVDNNYEQLKDILHVSLEIKTSSSSYAETTDDIRATFIGDFAVSGPHSLGSFLSPGSVEIKTVVFDRVIGKLNQILLSNRGTDGWLMADMRVTMGNTLYEFVWKRQWLDTIDPTLLDLYGNGYEPFCQESLAQLPAQSTLVLSVARTIPLIDVSGVYRPELASLMN